MEGYLLKQSDWIRKWNKRYCRVSPGALVYFVDELDKSPRGLFDLRGAEVKQSKSEPTTFSLSIKRPKREKLRFQCDTEVACKLWCDTLRATGIIPEKESAFRVMAKSSAPSSQTENTQTLNSNLCKENSQFAANQDASSSVKPKARSVNTQQILRAQSNSNPSAISESKNSTVETVTGPLNENVNTSQTAPSHASVCETYDLDSHTDNVINDEAIAPPQVSPTRNENECNAPAGVLLKVDTVNPVIESQRKKSQQCDEAVQQQTSTTETDNDCSSTESVVQCDNAIQQTQKTTETDNDCSSTESVVQCDQAIQQTQKTSETDNDCSSTESVVQCDQAIQQTQTTETDKDGGQTPKTGKDHTPIKLVSQCDETLRETPITATTRDSPIPDDASKNDTRNNNGEIGIRQQQFLPVTSYLPNTSQESNLCFFFLSGERNSWGRVVDALQVAQDALCVTAAFEKPKRVTGSISSEELLSATIERYCPKEKRIVLVVHGMHAALGISTMSRMSSERFHSCVVLLEPSQEYSLVNRLTLQTISSSSCSTRRGNISGMLQLVLLSFLHFDKALFGFLYWFGVRVSSTSASLLFRMLTLLCSSIMRIGMSRRSVWFGEKYNCRKTWWNGVTDFETLKALSFGIDTKLMATKTRQIEISVLDPTSRKEILSSKTNTSEKNTNRVSQVRVPQTNVRLMQTDLGKWLGELTSQR